MIALIDTCVIIDALQSREPFCAAAQEIFLAVANDKFIGFITAKSAADIYYLMHKSTHSDSKSRNVLNTLFNLFELIDTAAIDCKYAISSEISDYEDAIMVESAVRTGAACIVTRNIKDYSKSPPPVYSPEKFLDLLKNNDPTE